MPEFYINGKFVSQRLTGVQRYAYELTRCLQSATGDARLIAPAKAFWKKNYEGLNSPEMVGEKGNIFWEQVKMPGYLSKKGGPLLLNLCNVAPLLYKNKITCIHDVAFARYPAFFSRAFYYYYKTIMPVVIKTSRHIITVSEFSKRELIGHFKIREEKISVIPNGVSAHLLIPGHPPAVSKPYLLVVGSLDPRKNLLFLLNAFKKAELKNLSLVIIGAAGRSFNQSGNKELEPFLLHPDILFAGQVSDQELAGYYRHARALIAPSLYEGFGLPVIEALAAGTDVYASNIPSFREVGGENVLYFDPYEPTQLIDLLRHTDNNPSKPASGNHLMNSAYSWSRSAAMLRDLTDQFS